MILLRALAGLHDLVTIARGLRLGRFQLADLAADWLTDGAFTQHRDRAALLDAQQTRLPTAGCAWTGPWPAGALPVCTTVGDGAPIFLGYLDAPDPEARRSALARFFRDVADTFDPEEAGPTP